MSWAGDFVSFVSPAGAHALRPLFSPPALGNCLHRSLARRLCRVGWLSPKVGFWGAACESVHGDGESATPLWPHQRLDGPRWLEWRKSMGSSDEVRELRDDEIDGVNGGLVVIAIIAVLIGLLVPAVQ